MDATKFQDQEESILHPSQARDHGSTVDDVAHIHGGNQRICASENNIPLKHDGKDMHVDVTKATKKEREDLPVMQLTESARFTPGCP